MFIDDEIDRENASARIAESGAAAELIRESEWQRLRPYLEAFRSHGEAADMKFLRLAFEIYEQMTPACRAALAECFLAFGEIEPRHKPSS